MQYSKPPLSFEQQADKLIARGLAADRDMLVTRLQSVNYYRVTGYRSPVRHADDTYRAGTAFDAVWRRYTFDRRLRILLLDAIERVEVCVRTRTVYEHVHKYGPFGYSNPASLPKLSGARFGQFLARLDEEIQRSHEAFVKHFHAKYGDRHNYLPLWMAAEIMPFGSTLTLFRGASDDIKKQVSGAFNQPNEVFESWLLALNSVRNICAHHARLWNRTLGIQVKIPRRNKNPEWHAPVRFANDRLFAILTILRYALKYSAPQSHWPERLQLLLEEYPDVPPLSMGFPANWKDCPIWNA